MATVSSNSMGHGFRGNVGGLIFRQVNGKTIVSAKGSTPKKQSPAQKRNRDRFRQASEWARELFRMHPEKKAHYQRIAQQMNLPNAYTAAICEYMRRGRVENVDASRYHRKPGGKIRVYAHKKGFALDKIEVTIRDRNTQPLESGWAKLKGKGWYEYTTTQKIPDNIPIEVAAHLHQFGAIVRTGVTGVRCEV